MTAKLILAALMSLSMTGCVAVPLIASVASAGNSASQLCSMTRLPGQTTSLCDRLPIASFTQALGGKPADVTTVPVTPR